MRFTPSSLVTLKRRPFILVAFCATSLAAAEPLLPDVPQELPESTRGRLQATRAQLRTDLNALDLRIDRFNANCNSVAAKSPQLDTCRQEQGSIRDVKSALLARIDVFKTCLRLHTQLARDKTAIARQKKSIEDGNEQLKEWNKKRAEAEQAALKHAISFLVDTMTAGLDQYAEGKLAKIEAAFRKKGPEGETWLRKLEKVAELRQHDLRWSAISDGIKSAVISTPAAEALVELQAKTRAAEWEASKMDAILNEIRQDPEAKAIVEEAGLKTVAEFLKTRLKGWTSSLLSLGEFMATYSADAMQWQQAGTLIKQQIALRDRDLLAVDSLKKQIERTVGNLKKADCVE